MAGRERGAARREREKAPAFFEQIECRESIKQAVRRSGVGVDSSGKLHGGKGFSVQKSKEIESAAVNMTRLPKNSLPS